MLPLIVFFLSGFAALLYQVIWQRLLVIFSGADVYSVTVIVAAFMAGLGTGSLAGGHLADRFGASRNLYAFAGAELLIGLFGLISKWLFYDTLYVQHPQLGGTPMLAAGVLFVTLLVPTFLMGASLPLLARGLARSVRASPRVIGLLYACNTLGAAVGAFTAPWVLIPRLGLERSLWLAATVNVTCAVLATRLAASRDRFEDDTSHAAEGAAPEADNPETTLPLPLWVAVYGLTGFIALGLEIAWFRLLGVLLKSTSFTFGTVLAVYLAGLGLGAAAGARMVRRSRHPGATFLMLQYGVTLYAALSVTALVATLTAGHPVKLVRFLGSYEPVNVYETFARAAQAGWFDGEAIQLLSELAILYLVVPAVLVAPPTFLLGLSFPYLQKAGQADLLHLGRRLGALLASNIAGGVLGTVLCGWVLLPRLGTAGTLRALVGVSILLTWPFVRLAGRNRRLRTLGIAGAVALTLVAAWVMPTNSVLWARLHATTPSRVLFEEDSAGLSLLKFDRAASGGTVEVYVNGLGQSWLPYGNIHTALGALPAFIHPMPRDVAIIGLGSGDTAFAAAGRTDIQRLTSIEILGAQRRTLERLTRVQRYPGLIALLSDPRIDHRVGDGRAYLSHAGGLFDIIEADALRPSSASAGNLYSREYFALVRRQLKPGGYGVTWAPTERIRDTFLSVFPHVLAFIGDIYIGSDVPIAFDRDAVSSRLAGARYYYEAAAVDIMALLRPYLESAPRAFGPDDARRSSELNTDMFPRDEFALPF